MLVLQNQCMSNIKILKNKNKRLIKVMSDIKRTVMIKIKY